jgi:hypothetical protein
LTNPSVNQRTVRIGKYFLIVAAKEGCLASRSAAGQIEYWAKIGRAITSSPGFSAADINAVLAGQMTVEELNAVERATFFAHVPAMFENPSQEMVAAYANLSDDTATGTDPEPTKRRRQTPQDEAHSAS